MDTPRAYLALGLAAGLLGAGAGCSTVSSRIEANPTDFAQLTPNQQVMVRSGRVELGYGAAAAHLALGDPEYISYGSADLAETRVVRSYGDFMIPAPDLPTQLNVWHYRDRSLKRRVEGDGFTVSFNGAGRVGVFEREVPVGFALGTEGAPVIPAKASRLASGRAPEVPLGFDRGQVQGTLGAPDRATLRTDAMGSQLVWHYENIQWQRAADRTTVQDRVTVGFGVDGRVTSVEREVPRNFLLGRQLAAPAPLAGSSRPISGDQVALGFDPGRAERVMGKPDWVTLRTDSAGQTLVWHYEAARRYDTRTALPIPDDPIILVRYGVELAFDESGQVARISETVGERAD